MALAPISVQGASYSWGHLSVKLVSALGAPYEIRGFTDLSFQENLEVEKGTVLGSLRAPQRRSQGEYSVEDGTLSGYQNDVELLLRYLASQGSGSYGRPEFTVNAVFSNPTELVHVITLERCRVIGVSSAYSAGNALLKQDLTLSVMSISRDGLTLY